MDKLIFMRRTSPIKGKKGKARADAIRKKWQRIKEGEFESEEEIFKYLNLLKEKKGEFLKTKIGLRNVYSTEKLSNLERFVGGFVMPTHSIKKGYLLLKKHNLPVAKYRGIKKIGKEKRFVREKARDLTFSEITQRFDEILKIVKDASKKGIMIDLTLDNIGINKKNQIVIRDFNFLGEVKNKRKAFKVTIKILEDDVWELKRGASEKENKEIKNMIEKINQLKRKARSKKHN